MIAVPEILASGERVYITQQSHLHDQARPNLGEALSFIDSEGANDLRVEVIFPHQIGFNQFVAVSPGDNLAWGVRENRRERSLFVKNKKPEPSNTQVVVLHRAGEPQSYFLQTSFIGTTNFTPGLRAFALPIPGPTSVGEGMAEELAGSSNPEREQTIHLRDGEEGECEQDQKDCKEEQQKRRRAMFDTNYPLNRQALLKEYPDARPLRGQIPPLKKGKQIRKVIQGKTARQLIHDHSYPLRYDHVFYNVDGSGVGSIWLSKAYIGDALGACGYGRSKKIADEAAARALLALFGMPYPKVLEIRRY